MSLDGDQLNWRSKSLTEGTANGPQRAMLFATGLWGLDRSRPIIGIANTWAETTPCNTHLRQLADHVKRGVYAAGGIPMEFNTVVVSDAVISNANLGASLVSREIIADSIELAAIAYQFDGLVTIGGCDKSNAACLMALARVNIPGLYLYGGSMLPGVFRGRAVS